MTEAAVSFAGNLTDDPEVRSTESGIARAMFREAVSGRGSRSRRSSPWSWREAGSRQAWCQAVPSRGSRTITGVSVDRRPA
jgi:hypothetical protein